MTKWIKTNKGYEYITIKEYNRLEQDLHDVFYKEDISTWHVRIRKIISDFSKEYTEQHNDLKFMNN